LARTPNRKRPRWPAIALLLGLGLCAAASFALTLAPARGAELRRARARWDARPFTRYRLVTEHSGGLATCRQDVEVARERVAAVIANDCAREPLTVANLFLDIERYELTIGGRCGPNGCGCDGPIAVEARFDDQLGYPTLFQVRSQPEQRWRYLDYWRRQIGGGGCTLVGFGGPSIRVISLTPLP
jgi:hypothetical protein